jgi:hypothetical protein
MAAVPSSGEFCSEYERQREISDCPNSHALAVGLIGHAAVHAALPVGDFLKYVPPIGRFTVYSLMILAALLLSAAGVAVLIRGRTAEVLRLVGVGVAVSLIGLTWAWPDPRVWAGMAADGALLWMLYASAPQLPADERAPA